MENPIKLDDLGGTTIFGNPHIIVQNSILQLLRLFKSVGLVDTFDITDCLSFVLGSFNPTINYKKNAEAKRGTTRIPITLRTFLALHTHW